MRKSINFSALSSTTTRKDRKAVHSTYPGTSFQYGFLFIGVPILLLIGLYQIVFEGRREGITYLTTTLSLAYFLYIYYGVYRSNKISLRLRHFAQDNNFDFAEYAGKSMPEDGTFMGQWKVVRGHYAGTSFKTGVQISEKLAPYGNLAIRTVYRRRGFLRLKIADEALPEIKSESPVDLFEKMKSVSPFSSKIEAAFRNASGSYSVEVIGKYLYVWYPPRNHGRLSTMQDCMKFVESMQNGNEQSSPFYPLESNR